LARPGTCGCQHGFGDLLGRVWRVPLRQGGLYLPVHRGLLHHVQQQLD
jgi:hypothetical protein